MKSPADQSLAGQRRMLRRRLAAQRQRIARKIRRAPEVNSDYPRSMAMRLLARRPGFVVVGLFSGVATLLAGPRFFRFVTTALTLTGIVQSVIKKNGEQPVVSAADESAVSTA